MVTQAQQVPEGQRSNAAPRAWGNSAYLSMAQPCARRRSGSGDYYGSMIQSPCSACQPDGGEGIVKLRSQASYLIC